MSAPDNTITVIREWVAKAENDLTAAVQILKLGRNAPTDTICFHAAQCVEKYLKSLLILRGVPFPKTHDIRVLMKMFPFDARPELTDDFQDQFTQYAAVTRYPDAAVDIPLASARKALAAARRFRLGARRMLPKGALRRSSR